MKMLKGIINTNAKDKPIMTRKQQKAELDKLKSEISLNSKVK